MGFWLLLLFVVLVVGGVGVFESLWWLIVIAILLALFGGVGYSRRR